MGGFPSGLPAEATAQAGVRGSRAGRAGLFLFSIISLALLAFAYPPIEKYFEVTKSLDIFSTLFKEVNIYYVDEVEPKKLIDTGINEMLNTLDPYTEYIPEESGETFNILTTGQYAGIGALISQVNNKTVVRQPYVGFPAYEAGICVGDELISIDGKQVKGKASGDVSALLKGTPKTEVEVVVRRSGLSQDLTFKLKREKIKVNNVVCQEVIDGVGYLKMDDFTLGAAKEVENAILKFRNQNVKGLILDLRENGGQRYPLGGVSK